MKNATMSNNQAMQELKIASISDNENIQNLAKIEGHIDYLVAEFSRMEEEELQSHLMAEGHYMIDEDDASHSCHEHVLNTIILESNEIVDNNEEERKDEQIEHIGEEGKEEQIVDDIDEEEEKDEQIQHIEEQEEKEEQIEHRDQIKQEEQVEHKEKIEPPVDTSPSNDKEVSTEAHSFIIIPLATHHESKASKLQFFNVSKSYRMPRFSRIYADNGINLGIIVSRKYFQASKLTTYDGEISSQSAIKF
jgi:outer membrane biosynthesis protein TonB